MALLAGALIATSACEKPRTVQTFAKGEVQIDRLGDVKPARLGWYNLVVGERKLLSHEWMALSPGDVVMQRDGLLGGKVIYKGAGRGSNGYPYAVFSNSSKDPFIAYFSESEFKFLGNNLELLVYRIDPDSQKVHCRIRVSFPKCQSPCADKD